MTKKLSESSKIDDKVKNGDVLLWDRLGHSGRKWKRDMQHFNPTVTATIESKGGKIIQSPPKGMYMNPVELLFNDLKNNYIWPQLPKNSKNLSQRKLKAYVKNQASTMLQHFFEHSANGNQLIESSLLL